MARALTIVTYHYVRDAETSAFPRIKALPVAAFRRQLDAFEREFTIVDPQQVLDAANGAELPDGALLLTFDDGYADHYDTVFPLLTERGHRGVFFPATLPLAEGRVLDVNKIQFIVAAVADHGALAQAVRETVNAHRKDCGLAAAEVYWARFSGASRYDGPETAFVKRMLQKGLPAPLRAQLVDELFRRHVTTDEKSFAAALYAGAGQLGEMRAAGMHIGCHGHAHRWLDTLDTGEQRRDIETALGWLGQSGLIGERWMMCYPHGATDDRAAALLRSLGCALAMTVAPARADLDQDLMRLPRFDANDFAMNAAGKAAARSLPVN
ncbi:MAG TPA: polysaccharide deacetylase family protein [Pseudolabrys sp.]|nr:polysaccharide deacetylase family protein [Pseudolabrys sp.]